MIREVIKIDEEKCDGCGLCVPACNEGAIQIIDGKAQLISDLFCDGLGACIGECPQNAITIEKREAEPYNETKVMEQLILKSDNVIIAHLKHLKDHNELDYLNQAINFLNKHNRKIDFEFLNENKHKSNGSCPGSKMLELNVLNNLQYNNSKNDSMLSQWPIQLHLVNPMAPYFKNKELVIMSDCAPVASPNIHKDYLMGRSIVLACPKLDDTTTYIDKLASIFSIGNITRAIVVRMEVPCCGGLTQMAYLAAIKSGTNTEIVEDVLSLTGELIQSKSLIKRGQYVI